jgi:hypothetical protein
MMWKGSKRVLLTIALVALTGCANAQELSQRTPTGAIILPGSYIDKMLDQCSRSAPTKGEGTWMPSPAAIERVENRLAAELPYALKSQDLSTLDSYPAFPAAFHRQYLGIIRNGRKFIYGNIAQKYEGMPLDPMQNIIGVCDGGPVFFGAEFDVSADKFTHWAFNGSLG